MTKEENRLELHKMIDERIKEKVPKYLQAHAFQDRKLTDTPTDGYMVVSRAYVQLNGAVANRPKSSVATVGQFYLATDTNIPMWYTVGGWRNGVGSIIASNN